MSLFLTIRVLHILLASVWFGATVAMIFFVAPAIRDAKSAGGAVIAGVQSRKYAAIMQGIAGVTVLTGFYLYYRFTNHFDPQTNVIDVHISRLRSKIDKGFAQPLLHTIRGAGYMIRDK